MLRYLQMALGFLLDIWRSRRLLWEMTKKDLKERYVGSSLGILWAFIQPTITVFIFWFVFQVGFKSKPVGDFPFILWLVCGMFPWFFFSDALMSATGSIVKNSFLVKKVIFRVSLLPIIEIMSALVVNLFFVAVVFGLSLLTSSLMVFLKDVGQLVGMALQFGFWGTPIFWSLDMIPEAYQIIFKMNPLYYIVEGYRMSFISHEWFWERGFTNLGFWLVTAAILLLGIVVFKKLRPHFADVL